MTKIKTAIDIKDNDVIVTDEKIGIDSKGHLIEKMDDITAYDWSTGELRYVYGWKKKNKKLKDAHIPHWIVSIFF